MLMDRDMQQRELADTLGWDSARLSRLLHGKSRWTVDDMVAVAGALDVDLVDLLAGLPHLDSNQKPAGFRRHHEAITKIRQRRDPKPSGDPHHLPQPRTA
jgi:transcriptional regulator with XRE-family HTH domain